MSFPSQATFFSSRDFIMRYSSCLDAVHVVHPSWTVRFLRLCAVGTASSSHLASHREVILGPFVLQFVWNYNHLLTFNAHFAFSLRGNSNNMLCIATPHDDEHKCAPMGHGDAKHYFPSARARQKGSFRAEAIARTALLFNMCSSLSF